MNPPPHLDLFETCACSGERARRSQMIEVAGQLILPQYKDDFVALLRQGKNSVKRKRPASVIWAAIAFSLYGAMFGAGFISLLRSGDTPWQALAVTATLSSVLIAPATLIWFKTQNKITFALACPALALLNYLSLKPLLTGTIIASNWRYITSGAFLILVLHLIGPPLITWRFIFGKPSRKYFGFVTRD